MAVVDPPVEGATADAAGRDDDLAALTAGLLASPDDATTADRPPGDPLRRHHATDGVTGGALDDEIRDEDLVGVGGDELPLGEVLAAGGTATAAVLFGLNLVDEFDGVTMRILGPDIQDTFGLSDTALAALANVGAVAVLAGAVPLGILADRRRRNRIIGATSLLWAAAAAAGGLTRTIWQLATTRIFNGFGKGAGPAHASMLADAYPVEGRGRIFAAHALANPIGNIVGPLLAGGIAAYAGGTEGWRWSLVALSVPALVLAIAALRLPEPRRGGFERDAAQGLATDDAAVQQDGDETVEEVAEPIAIGAGYQRLRSIKTFAALLSGFAALGLAITGVPTIANLVLEDHYDLGALGRGVVAAITSVGGMVGLLIGGRATDRLFRRDPAAVLKVIAATVLVVGIAFPASIFVPAVWQLVVIQAIASAAIAAPGAAINSILSVIVPPRMRGLAYGMVGVYLVLVGGLMGGVLTGVLSDAIGQRFAIAVVMPTAMTLAAAFIYSAHRHVRGDIARTVAELRDEREEAERRRSTDTDGELLQVRGLDLSYGAVQVLFDVDLTVERGEILALLGTNGAGKSTLLRAISGLSVSSAGVIRFDGTPITFADPVDRVGRGIVAVPGGKAIFPSLTVRENLIAGAYTYVWDAELVDERAARVLARFPRLAERIDQPAGTLSGGEAQMLAIGKALMLEPELLLIDELSLGLAPVVVQELLGVVEALRASGMTIVIVEQSVNVALAIADRAVFMEKGQVRFEGPAADLLERGDLVRAVFLGNEGG